MYLIVENKKDITGATPWEYQDGNVKTIEVTDDVYTRWLKDKGMYIYSRGKIVVNPEHEQQQAEEREQQFKKDFFCTSLGWIRREVAMKTGKKKDFLTDLVPVISLGVSSGQQVNIITYREPDYTQEVVDWEALQEIKQATPQFLQECLNQVNIDFVGAENE